MHVTLKETRLGLRNSTTRLPFRYGSACLTRCPQAVLQVAVEADGVAGIGYSGDCLPPSWFDKSPGKPFAEQVRDMLAVIGLAEEVFAASYAQPTAFFPAWLESVRTVHAECTARGVPPLLASLGTSLVERAMVDALCRVTGTSFAVAVRRNLLGLVPADVHSALAGCEPAAWLPAQPVEAIYVRHTVGLGDPLTDAEISDDERLEDGFPQSLEEYVRRDGLRYFKIKVANDLPHDLDRLGKIARIVEAYRGGDYGVTIDGNEQYRQANEFDQLIEAMRREPDLALLWRNTVAIEQPLERSIALGSEQTRGIRELSGSKPVIIDESDGSLDSYRQAIELGYRGVSSKNCKGPIKSLLNAGLTWLANERGARSDYLMTGEDLCTVGVVPVQADLCLVATLGLHHVERNGHHYHPGLTYLPAEEQEAALAAHPDLYARQRNIIAPRIVDGKFLIGTLQCPGFGFACLPDMETMQSRETWRFESLGM